MTKQKSQIITIISVFITLIYIVGDLFAGLSNDILRDIQRITHHVSEPRQIFIEAIVMLVTINAFILATLIMLKKMRKLSKTIRRIISFGIIIGLVFNIIGLLFTKMLADELVYYEYMIFIDTLSLTLKSAIGITLLLLAK
ncbi:hypothetical protein [Alkaliphilus peptidifermentans]|uniref:Uncharacterized protein n=1 Tax=Alkaliphilus peptidifermentans DSM 18978 TaxID=1120976 RepID=A0A1G5KZY7_9FIRM|nr:hypothetical protein [Alkaliphilus peptidifermentans]SCZ05904.1 hypothetical protein SAMN03080606_03910 [Alkaliphilus peptidifermentans DSM 18978]